MTAAQKTPTGALFKFLFQPISSAYDLCAACSSVNMADFGSPGTPSRHEKSLGLLTTKFVNLLQEAKDGVLDLKVVRKLWNNGQLQLKSCCFRRRLSVPLCVASIYHFSVNSVYLFHSRQRILWLFVRSVEFMTLQMYLKVLA